MGIEGFQIRGEVGGWCRTSYFPNSPEDQRQHFSEGMGSCSDIQLANALPSVPAHVTGPQVPRDFLWAQCEPLASLQGSEVWAPVSKVVYDGVVMGL